MAVNSKFDRCLLTGIFLDNMDKKTRSGVLPTEKLTKDGKIRAAYTLKCVFNDGNQFTYRSDVNLEDFTKKGYKYITELDALVLKFSGVRDLIDDCKLFDNRMPVGEDLLLHYSGMIGKIVVNNLPKNYKL